MIKFKNGFCLLFSSKNKRELYYRVIKELVTALSCLMLTSCSFLSPVKMEPIKNYELNKTPKNIPHKRSHHLTLLVLQPEARPIYNTNQMAYSTQPYQIAYFSQNQWAETPAQMLQPLLIQTLQRTHYFHAIVAQPYVGYYQYSLGTQILKIQQDFIQHPVASIVINVQIIKTLTAQVIASKQFSMNIPMTQKSAYAGVIATNQAMAIILQEITKFILKNMR